MFAIQIPAGITGNFQQKIFQNIKEVKVNVMVIVCAVTVQEVTVKPVVV